MPFWNTFNNRTAWKLYLGDRFETHDVPCYAAPARATDYSGLPPAITYVGDLDPFFDETVAYIDNLTRAGIPAECRVYEGCYHGFDVVCPGAAISIQATEEFFSSFQRAAERYFAPQP